MAATLSAVLPGLGQLVNGRHRLARRLFLPFLAVGVVGWLVVQVLSGPRLLATLVDPAVLSGLLVVNVLVLAWRVGAVGQAFFDRQFTLAPGRNGLLGLALLVAVVALPHGLVTIHGLNARDTFGGVFAATSDPDDDPGSRERTNVLLIGIDKTATRTATLTDTMMLVSVDPVGRTISMLSIPRDLVDVPLGNGDTYAPKLNSLMSYANRHPEDFPRGGVQALRDAVEALLGVEVHYHATLDFVGFVKMVDAVGGVDVTVAEGFDDPTYDGYGLPQHGWSITAGRHRLDGINALAYVRARKASGESDFTRAARQQQVLIALRDRAMRGGGLVAALPNLLAAVRDMVTTDFPVGRLPELAAIVEEAGAGDVVRVVIRAPLVTGGRNRYGSVQVPDIAAIRAMAGALFPEPGLPPEPWPTAKPSPASPSARP